MADFAYFKGSPTNIYNVLRWKIADNLPEGKSSAGMST